MRLNSHRIGLRLRASGPEILRSGRRKADAGRRFDIYAD
jgi:hypothetical protein